MLRRQTADALSELDLDRGVRDSKAMTELVTDLAEESVSVHELCRHKRRVERCCRRKG